MLTAPAADDADGDADEVNDQIMERVYCQLCWPLPNPYCLPKQPSTQTPLLHTSCSLDSKTSISQLFSQILHNHHSATATDGVSTKITTGPRMAEVARKREGPTPKSLDSDQNYKP